MKSCADLRMMTFKTLVRIEERSIISISVMGIVNRGKPEIMAKLTHLEVGKTAPAFHLDAYPEGKIRLSSFKGTDNVVLYFYPKDNTPGCTTEACDFRDQNKKFKKKGTVVLGISPDSVKSHQKFIEKFELPFILLSDEDHKICEKYGVWVEKSMYGRKYMGVQRATFLINKKGKIAAIWPKVSIKGHVDEVLKAIDELE